MKGNNSENVGSNLKNCPVRSIIDRFGGKWAILIILILGEKGKLRFNKLYKEIGNDISQKMLTATLRTLEADGLVTRILYPEVPPRVEYEITKMGETLLPHITGLTEWADNNFKAIITSREKYCRN